ncbi:MAG: chorismate mutase [Syntrophomonadaceae bacterium]|jgi:chorismate mutase/prephenate dehydratase|nr:chorismate mutase [Syntrophomonadaceae bacterium]
MEIKEKLESLRREIDIVDKQMQALFADRMKISESIAQVKAEGNLAIEDEVREQYVLNLARLAACEKNQAEMLAFMKTLIAFSKMKQRQELMLVDPIELSKPAAMKTTGVSVAYQGVPGAWSHHSAQELFKEASYNPCEDFADVFEAIKKGRADYGVLPIENSQTGAIGEVYDLLRKYSCFIVGEIWIPIAQCLLAIKGAELTDIREIFSHPEGFKQSRRFLKNKNWDLTACRNTAYAAQLVARENEKRSAAIGSGKAAEVYGLSVLVPDIMDNPHNKTRFIAIAAEPVYDENCATTSITFSTVHQSGALCSVLQCFMLSGINISRIESRPAADNKYRFFADLQGNIMSEDMKDALRQAAAQSSYFEVLGCYPTAAGK